MGGAIAMRPSEAVVLHRQEMFEIITRHGFSNPRIFGSIARGNDDERSDIDLLVDTPENTSLMDLASLLLNLEDLTGFKFSICTLHDGLRDSFRQSMLRDAKPLADITC
jgi:predicted nucleotidyltransferase